MSQEMRAVVVTEHGDPEVLKLTRVAAPEPGPGQIRVRVAASGVNRADLLQRKGLYPVPPGYPADIPGLEYAGVVDAVGEHVSSWSVGQAVMGITGGGGYAEFVVVHEREAIPVPDALDPVTAGAVPEVFLTAFDAVVRQVGLRAGELLLIHAVGSGVGTAAVQLARWLGAVTAGTSRTPEKLEGARELGLDHAVEGREGWSERFREATGGRGADVILDLVGGPYLEENLKALAPRGRMITVGISGGRKATIDLRTLMARRGTLVGTVLRARPLEEKAALAQDFARVALPALGRGVLKPVVDTTFPPEAAAEAHARMEANDTFGKLLLVW